MSNGIPTVKDLLARLKAAKKERRAQIGNTRTKEASSEAKGEVMGLDTAIELVEEFEQTQEEIRAGARDNMGNVVRPLVGTDVVLPDNEQVAVTMKGKKA